MIVVLFGFVGIVWGYIIQQFSQTVYILGAGLVLATVVSQKCQQASSLRPRVGVRSKSFKLILTRSGAIRHICGLAKEKQSAYPFSNLGSNIDFWRLPTIDSACSKVQPEMCLLLTIQEQANSANHMCMK
jgi:hypothetical protein